MYTAVAFAVTAHCTDADMAANAPAVAHSDCCLFIISIFLWQLPSLIAALSMSISPPLPHAVAVVVAIIGS